MKPPVICGDCHPALFALDTPIPSQQHVPSFNPTIFVQLSTQAWHLLSVHGLGQPAFKIFSWDESSNPILVIGLRIGEHEHRVVVDIGDPTIQAALTTIEKSNEILLIFSSSDSEDTVQLTLRFPLGLISALAYYGARASRNLPQRLAEITIVSNRIAQANEVACLSSAFTPKTISIGLVLTNLNSKLLFPVILTSQKSGQSTH